MKTNPKISSQLKKKKTERRLAANWFPIYKTDRYEHRPVEMPTPSIPKTRLAFD